MVAMTLPLHCAAERPFCVCQLLHFCQLLSNPSIDLKLEYNFGKPMKRRFQRFIVHVEILSTFHARVKYISVKIMPLKPLGQCGQTTPKSPCSPWGTWTPSNTWMPWVTPLTTPNDSSIAARTSAQLRNKGPIGYNGTPQIHPFDDHHPIYYTHPSTDPTHQPRRHPHPISCFATVQFPDRHTDTHTDRQMGRRQVRNMSAYANYMESDALIMLVHAKTRHHFAEYIKTRPVENSLHALIHRWDVELLVNINIS